MLGSMDGKHGEVYVEYVSLMVSYYWIKVSLCMIVKQIIW